MGRPFMAGRSAESIAQAVRLVEAGASQRSVAQELGISTSTMSAHVARAKAKKAHEAVIAHARMANKFANPSANSTPVEVSRCDMTAEEKARREDLIDAFVKVAPSPSAGKEKFVQAAFKAGLTEAEVDELMGWEAGSV